MSLQRVLFYMDGFCVPPHTAARTGTIAAYRDEDGLLRHEAADVLRRSWANVNGIWTPTILTETPRTNLLLRSQELDDASWTKTRASITANQFIGPDGTLTLDEIVEDATATNSHTVTQNVTVTANQTGVLSGWFKAGARSWVALKFFDAGASANIVQAWFNLATGALGTSSAGGTGVLVGAYIEDWTDVTDGLYRCVVAGSVNNGATSLTCQIALATQDNSSVYSGDGASSLFGGFVQFEDGFKEASSYIPTISATDDRDPDTVTADFLYDPADLAVIGGMSVYVEFIEGMVPTFLTEGGLAGRLVNIGASGGSNGRFQIARVSGADQYQALYRNMNGTQVTATVDVNPTRGDRIQLVGQWLPDGSVALYVAKNGGAVSSNASSALRWDPSWTQTIRLGHGSATVARGIQHFIKVAAVGGLRDISYCASLSPAMALGGYAIPLAVDSVRYERLEIGDRGRSYDGTLRETIRSRKAIMRAETTPLTVADRNKVLSLLEASTQPQTVFGEALRNSTGGLPLVNTRVEGEVLVQSSTDRRYALTVVAEESS